MSVRLAGTGRNRVVSRTGRAAADTSGHFAAGVAVLAAGTLVVLSSVLLSPGIDAVTKHFESQSVSWASPDLVAKMMVTSPAVVVAIVAPFGGWLLDRLGRRQVLLASLAIFGLAGGVGGLLSNPATLLASRVVFGLGVAGLLLASTTLIGDYFDGSRRRQMLGWQIAAISVVSTAGMFLAAYLVQISWRIPFAIYLLALPLLPWAWAQIDEPSEEEKSDDADADEQDGIPWFQVGLVYVAAFLALAIFHLATTQIPSYLGELGYGSPYMTALIISIISVAGIPSSILFDKARDRFSNQSLLVGVFGVGAIGFGIAGVYESIGTLVAGLTVFGLLYGFRTPAFNAWLLNCAPAEFRGRLVGGLTSACFAGIFASPLLSEPLKQAVGMPGVILVSAGLQLAFAAAFAYFVVVKGRGQCDDGQCETS